MASPGGRRASFVALSDDEGATWTRRELPIKSTCGYVTATQTPNGVIHIGTQLAQSFWGAMVAFAADAIVTVVVSLMTQPKTDEEMRGLVWGLTRTDEREEELTAADRVWWRNTATSSPASSSATRFSRCGVLTALPRVGFESSISAMWTSPAPPPCLPKQR